jgi:plastocyanin
VTIDMRDVRYLPPAIRIRAGDTVAWRNSDPFAHGHQAGPGASCDSGDIHPGGTFARTF